MRVSDVMTRDLFTLPLDATVAVGLRCAEERDLHHVLIVTQDKLAGIACVCDLRERASDDSLESCITRPPDVIEPDRSLDEAAERFVAACVSCFPVCDGEDLVGVITRSDLRRSLVPETKLPASFECSFCGSTRHVRPFRRNNEALAVCLECTDRSVPASSDLYDEGDEG